jgi:antitoxin MazE
MEMTNKESKKLEGILSVFSVAMRWLDNIGIRLYNVIILYKGGPLIKKLVSHGNSAALVIDKPILELLHVDMDTPLEITTDGRSLIISPVENEKRHEKFKAAIEKVNRRHAASLRRLAE